MDKFEVPLEKVELGIVETKREIGAMTLQKVETGLYELGFELLSNEKSKLIESIRKIAIQQARTEDNKKASKNLSQVLTEQLHLDYNYLSALFSDSEGQTIEKFQDRKSVV